jgi:hypothetical protein
MTDATQFQFTNPAAPKAYDEFFVPNLFAPWAVLLLDEAPLRPGDCVLDVATWPGTVARLAAQRVGTQRSDYGSRHRGANVGYRKKQTSCI